MIRARDKEIISKYVDKVLPASALAEEYGLTKTRILQILRAHGVVVRERAGPRRGMQDRSVPDRLSELGIGDSLWVETTVESMQQDMTNAVPYYTRLALPLSVRKFTTRLFTAVGSRDCTDIRYLIEVKRTA